LTQKITKFRMKYITQIIKKCYDIITLLMPHFMIIKYLTKRTSDSFEHGTKTFVLHEIKRDKSLPLAENQTRPMPSVTIYLSISYLL
jgi:hypothetical protein